MTVPLSGNAPAFYHRFHTHLAKCVNALRGRWENMWSTEEPCLVEVAEPNGLGQADTEHFTRVLKGVVARQREIECHLLSVREQIAGLIGPHRRQSRLARPRGRLCSPGCG